MADKRLVESKNLKSSSSKNHVDSDSSSHAVKPSWNLAQLFWGLLLVLIGSLILLDNLNIVDVYLWNIWRLWPLLIIIGGVSVLSLRGKVWSTIGVVMIALTLGAISWAALNENRAPVTTTETSTAAVEQADKDIELLDVTLKAGASKLSINSSSSEPAISARLASNVSKLIQKTSTEGTTQHVSIEMEDHRGWWGDVTNDIEVRLGQTLPLVMTVHAGASTIDADFSAVPLQKLDMDAGASNVTLRIGAKSDTTNIKLDAGVSAVKILIPKESGVRLLVGGGLNSKSLGDLREVTENTWESDGYTDAEQKVLIEGDMGLASLSVERY